jgi:cell fate regulator YaaT (PSP1 superfamily)
MKKIIGVRFKKPGKIYFFDPGNLEINKNDNVIVETTMGEEIGIVVIPKREIKEEKLTTPLKKVIRVANKNDLDSLEKYKKKEPEALKICKEKIKKYKLDMNLIDVEYKFDGSKILFYFTADGRIDFRELVKDLASVFRTRIELRQIGVRDEVKRIGGNGVCGRELCCCTFLNNFETVSIKMAKEQNIALNPSKISGNCGRLMCCLKYEQDVYSEKLSRLPKVGAIVKTEAGEGTVEGVEVLKEVLKVKIKDGDDYTYKKFDAKDVKVIKESKNNNVIDEEEKENLKELQKLEKLEKMDQKNKSNDDEI